MTFYTFPNWTDDKIYVTEITKFVLGRVENIMGKGENAGYQHFLLFPIMLSKGSFLRVVNSHDYVVKSDMNFNTSFVYF